MQQQITNTAENALLVICRLPGTTTRSNECVKPAGVGTISGRVSHLHQLSVSPRIPSAIPHQMLQSLSFFGICLQG